MRPTTEWMPLSEQAVPDDITTRLLGAPDASLDEVNLKAELEIVLLHDKVDGLREKQWQELLALQKEQFALLSALAAAAAAAPRSEGAAATST